MVGSKAENDLWLRQEAVRLVAGLPDDVDQSRTILKHALLLIDGFIDPRPAADRQNVVTLPPRRLLF